MKLNFGAGTNWIKSGWHIIDQKVKKNSSNIISYKSGKINLRNSICDIVFSSHTFEHISHLELPLVISEINRVMKKNGILRIVTPDLEKIHFFCTLISIHVMPLNRTKDANKDVQRTDTSLRNSSPFAEQPCL